MKDIAKQWYSSVVTWCAAPGAWTSPHHKRFWVIIALVVYTLSGFFLLPWVARHQIVENVGLSLERPVELDEVRINPFLLSFDARGFRVKEADGSEIIGFDRLFINFQLSSIFRWAWTFREIRLEQPSAAFIRYSIGDSNFARLLRSEEPASPPATEEQDGNLRLLIGELALRGGIVAVTDHVPTTRFESELGPINISVLNLSTLPDDRGQQQVVIHTKSGTRLEWTGSLELYPLHSVGRVTGSGPYVPMLYRYFQDMLAIEQPTGAAELEFEYEIKEENHSLAVHIENLDFALRGLAVNSVSGSEDILDLPEIILTGGWLKFPERMAGVGQLSINDPKLHFWREPDGVLNLQRLLVTTSESDTAPEGQLDAGESDWSLQIDRFEINNLNTKFEDRALREQGLVEIVDMDFSLDKVSNIPGARFPLALGLEIAAGGRTDLDGQLSLLPTLGLDAKLSVSELQLAVMQPYVTEAANVRIEKGNLNLNAELSFSAESPLVTNGNISVRALAVSDTVKSERLLGWDEFAIDRFEFAADRNELEISEVTVSTPYVRMLIQEDQSTNFRELMVEQNQEKPPAASNTSPTEQSPTKVTIGQINIVKGSADFTDLALPFPFTTRIEDLNGEVTTLATGSQEPARLKIEGQVDDYGLARIEGTVMPMGPTELTDIQVLFRNVELPDLSPYTVKFAGRRIADGRLELDLRYLIEAGILNGENNIVISDLELGEKVDYPNAMSLPLGLAVALLKGPDGKITIDLEVAGDVNSPEFGVASVVMQAIANLIGKIVTSPFRLLGKLVGIESDEFDLIEFEPGLADLTPPEQEKLVKLAEALTQRPVLRLQVPRPVNTIVDAAALREIHVDARIEERMTILANDEDDTEMLAERRQQAMESLFQLQFPDVPLETVSNGFLRPENPDEPDKNLTLDQTAYIAELRSRMVAAAPIGQSDLDDLAGARGAAVLQVLTADGTIDESRVTLEARDDAKIGDSGWVQMKLGVESAE